MRLPRFRKVEQLRRPWIGVDLDGTLAVYGSWQGREVIGAPVPGMVERVKALLAAGHEVRIFTARACDPKAVPYVERWLVDEAGLPKLRVTNHKDYDMIGLFDDLAIRVRRNEGIACCDLRPLFFEVPLAASHPGKASSVSGSGEDA